MILGKLVFYNRKRIDFYVYSFIFSNILYITSKYFSFSPLCIVFSKAEVYLFFSKAETEVFQFCLIKVFIRIWSELSNSWLVLW